MIRVLIVDDQVLIRSAVGQILSMYPDIEVVGEADNGQAALRQLRATPADVVVMDIQMPGLDGIEVTTRIRADDTLSDTLVLILTTFDDDANVAAALQAGASGFLGKSAQPEQIANAIRVVHAGEAILSPAATSALITRYLAGVSTPGQSRLTLREALTPREGEVLHLVARGLSNEEIADELVISTHTAKTHVNRIMVKLDARNRTELVVWAYETRFVTPPGL
ncbi:MAG: response regulator transcription factor [Mobilicoccus sp.]|nr:response regulator transcription factor [Mobilicoccus sp.]